MSLQDYTQGKRLSTHCVVESIGFFSVIQCAMRMASPDILEKLRSAFPEIWHDYDLRLGRPNGILAGEEPPKPPPGPDVIIEKGFGRPK